MISLSVYQEQLPGGGLRGILSATLVVLALPVRVVITLERALEGWKVCSYSRKVANHGREGIRSSLGVLVIAFPQRQVVHGIIVEERLRLQVFKEAGVEEHKCVLAVAGFYEVLARGASGAAS